jgi:hypothetical protein
LVPVNQWTTKGVRKRNENREERIGVQQKVRARREREKAFMKIERKKGERALRQAAAQIEGESSGSAEEVRRGSEKRQRGEAARRGKRQR